MMRESYNRIIVGPDGHQRLAVLDISEYGTNTVWVNRINVPLPLRGKGIGRMLMEELLYDADRLKVNICLVVNPSGREGIDPGRAQLEAWYARCGFRCSNGLWFREPIYGRVPSDFRVRQDRGRISIIQWNELVSG